MWVGLLAVGALGVTGTALYFTKKQQQRQLPPGPPPKPGAVPPSDDTCNSQQLIDAVTWQCADLCPDDSRPCNGLCVGYAGGPLTPQGTPLPFTSVATGSTLAPQTTYLESLAPVTGMKLSDVAANLTNNGFSGVQSFDVGTVPAGWPKQDQDPNRWRIIFQTPATGAPITVAAGLSVFRAPVASV